MLDPVTDELADYYKNNYRLSEYTPYAKSILNYYIYNEISGDLVEYYLSEECYYYEHLYNYYQVIDKLERLKMLSMR